MLVVSRMSDGWLMVGRALVGYRILFDILGVSEFGICNRMMRKLFYSQGSTSNHYSRDLSRDLSRLKSKSSK